MGADNVAEESAVDERTPVSRREFLDLLLGGALATSVLAGAGTLVTYLSPPQVKMRGAGEPMAVAEEQDVPVNTGRVVAYGSTKVMVVHQAEGYVALSAICTHAGCLVQWDAEAGRIHCPCHDGMFDLKGNVISGPPPSPLKVYRAEVVGGKVMVADA